MATSVTISYDALCAQFVAGTFRVTAGPKNGITIPPTIDTSCRIIYSSDLNSLTRAIQAAPLTPNQIEFYDTQGTRFCTLSNRRKDNTFGSVANVSNMPNVFSNIQFPEPSSTPTYLAVSCYPGLLECASVRARKYFLQQDMELLKSKYPVNELSLFVATALFEEIKAIEPMFWAQFKEVLVTPLNITSFVSEYICGRYVTEKVSHSQHTLTFGSKVLSAQFFNSSVKATVRTEGVQISTCGTVETNFIVFLDNPNPDGDEVVVVADKSTGAVFQPTQMWSLDPSLLHILIAANKFYTNLPVDYPKFQPFSTENTADVVRYMFNSPLKVFDGEMKGLNELEQNVVSFGKGLRLSIYNKMNQFLQIASPANVSTFGWGGGPPAPQLDLMLGRQHSCAASEM